jgi:hypothetical protein
MREGASVLKGAGSVSKTSVFVTSPTPLSKPAVDAYKAVTKPISKSKYQYFTNSMSFEALLSSS